MARKKKAKKKSKKKAPTRRKQKKKHPHANTPERNAARRKTDRASPRTEFTPAEVKHIAKMAGHGLTVTQLAAAMKCGKRTFERRISETPGGLEELERGRAKAIDRIAGRLFTKADKGAGWAIKFFLKTKGGFKERHVLETDPKDDDDTISAEERQRKIEGYIAKRNVIKK